MEVSKMFIRAASCSALIALLCLIRPAPAHPLFCDYDDSRRRESADITSCNNPYPFTFILESSRCRPHDQLLIVIHSSITPAYNDRRMLARATWLNRFHLNKLMGLNVKIVFFLGKTNSPSLQRRLEYESEVYGDIVQSNFEDTYEHNTYKVMSYLLWSSLNCADASLLMKIDDDALLKTQRWSALNSTVHNWISSAHPIYSGKSVNTSSPNRCKNSKWYTSWRVWPKPEYPIWFQGLVYFLTPRHTGLLFNTALTTCYMFTDDVFVGIIVNKTDGIQFKIHKLNNISIAFGPQQVHASKLLPQLWTESEGAAMFHLPNKTMYYLWALADIGHLPAQPAQPPSVTRSLDSGYGFTKSLPFLKTLLQNSSPYGNAMMSYK